MEIRSLTTFLKVAGLKSFTKASEELGCSQSNVSTQIKQLEEQLGVPLFHRIGKTVSLTEYGEMLVDRARIIVAEAAEVEQLFREDEKIRGSIRVGMSKSILEAAGGDMLKDFRKAFPGVTVNFVVEPAFTLRGMVGKGSLDVAMLAEDASYQSNLLSLYSRELPVYMVTNPNHPLTKEERVSWKDLEGAEFIYMEETSRAVIRFRNQLEERGVSVHMAASLSGTGTIKAMVEEGNYLTLLPDYVVRKSLERGRLKRLSLPGFEEKQVLRIVVNRDTVLTAPVKEFVAVMEQFAKGNRNEV